jgi:hypothetical protein
MNEAVTTQVSLTGLPAATGAAAGAGLCEQPEIPIPLAETIAELRFKENVYQSFIEVSRRTLAVLSMFELSNSMD